METISRTQLLDMMSHNPELRLVEVLGPGEYRDYHLPGAINVPVGKDFEEDIQRAIPNRQAEVVVYCRDEDCTASPKAAQRMDRIGYGRVFDYAAGKRDWKEAGLPIE